MITMQRSMKWAAAGLLFAVVAYCVSNVRPAEQSAEAVRPLNISRVSTFDGPAAMSSGSIRPAIVHRDSQIQLCQALGPAAPCAIQGVDCSSCNGCCQRGWEGMSAIPFQAYAQGEYVGHARTQHVQEYRLRPDDVIEFVYRITREETSAPYQLQVGDEIRVESVTDTALDRQLVIQPDGTITPRLLGQIKATHHTVSQLRDELENLYGKYYKDKKVVGISVTPTKVNTKLEDLRAAVDARAGTGGQNRISKVTPDGTISLPAIAPVMAQGLTLIELQREINARYSQVVEGIEVTPVLTTRAARFIYVVGEVRLPGRYIMEGPTTVMQAISLAGSWNVGANLRQVVVFRRGDDWRLLGTVLDLGGALNGTKSCPAGEIWLSDSDLVIVPKSLILQMDDFISLVFTHGVYGVVPFSTSYSYGQTSSLR